ncbi:hypothetical protein EPA93_24475 [Ktedonosporobacter rubrisoli]|uniref:Uncharacterized protein n=1 Tax=Ktedonosporobacter rubrisoli TaxID=2509675 RepID=A0A4P6JVH8_KTERU|nr:hypothetical protein [Ktedonosporobacter rubrisoli]QBD78966.1 hypothetical protein EPA93_24475 [Ktedonosporobacter rubrisoli]
MGSLLTIIAAQNWQAGILKIAIPIGLSHQRFGAIVFALDRALGKASRQKVKKLVIEISIKFLINLQKAKSCFFMSLTKQWIKM